MPWYDYVWDFNQSTWTLVPADLNLKRLLADSRQLWFLLGLTGYDQQVAFGFVVPCEIPRDRQGG